MKLRSESQSLERIADIKSELRAEISDNFEHRAKSCVTCETPGACCLDAHFVNIRISRLEAVAINRFLDAQPLDMSTAVRERIDGAIAKYDLAADADQGSTYACPLFQAGKGCLVHDIGKPVPCIVHACYESLDDLPPDVLADMAELAIDRMNKQTYGVAPPILPIPLALKTNQN